MAQSGRSKLKQPNAVVELVLKEGQVREREARSLSQCLSMCCVVLQETDKVHVDFTHTQLFDFYTQVSSSIFLPDERFHSTCD